jgi:hypothetical protein
VCERTVLQANNGDYMVREMPGRRCFLLLANDNGKILKVRFPMNSSGQPAVVRGCVQNTSFPS